MTQIISAIGSVLRDVLFYLSFHIPGIVVPRPGFHSVSLLSSSGPNRRVPPTWAKHAV